LEISYIGKHFVKGVNSCEANEMKVDFGAQVSLVSCEISLARRYLSLHKYFLLIN
jgi:hypothetical protein